MTDKPEAEKTDPAKTAKTTKTWVAAGVGAAAIGSAAIVAALLYTKKDKGRKE
jgi:hypothetical protein